MSAKGFDGSSATQPVAPENLSERPSVGVDWEKALKQLNEIVGASPQMQRLKEQVLRAVDGDLTVCVEGETGTGKELIARAIHRCSSRSHAPFVVLDCTAVPDALIESELFGHMRGAFTDARTEKKGLIEIADRGTLFLDEVSSASPLLQNKLLRVLQEGEFLPVGSVKPRRVNVRVVSATNVSLEELVSQLKFREDLFYRLYLFAIRVPSLRERRDDIPLLAYHFLKGRSFFVNKYFEGVSKEALTALVSYGFPGNVRELKNEIERAMAMTAPDETMIEVHHLSDRIMSKIGTPPAAASESLTREPEAAPPGEGLREAMTVAESKLIRDRLADFGGNVSRTARSLRLSRRGLMKKINRLGLRRAKPGSGQGS